MPHMKHKLGSCSYLNSTLNISPSNFFIFSFLRSGFVISSWDPNSKKGFPSTIEILLVGFDQHANGISNHLCHILCEKTSRNFMSLDPELRRMQRDVEWGCISFHPLEYQQILLKCPWTIFKNSLDIYLLKKLE